MGRLRRRWGGSEGSLEEGGLGRLRRRRGEAQIGEAQETWGGSEIEEAQEAQKKLGQAQKEAWAAQSDWGSSGSSEKGLGRLRRMFWEAQKEAGEAQEEAWRCSGGSNVLVAERVGDSGF